jgi:fatty-acyl-CoA synthase
VWIADDLPVTATNKIVKRILSAQGLDVAAGVLWRREGRSRQYQPFGPGVSDLA